MSTRIMMVDDHRILREALRGPLAAEPDLLVVAEVGSGQEALDRLETDRPDLLLLDIALPDMTGTDVARQALARFPELRIVALSGYADKTFVDEMLKAGARAYVVKSAGTHELIMAIRAVLAGHVFLSPEITAAMIGQPVEVHASAEPSLNVLGQREQEVLALVVRGLRSADIAHTLGIQSGTVDVHRANIKKKLGLTSIAELIRYAIRHGFPSA
ncbi:MAG: response regulator transcription factor [Rhodocyclaceae bacterium]|nr:response regulator transcription factor [Rhodocyclaceae bacterium]MDZ4214902.1 response regulator transcription factor [Rhodocyclaceae bacterium]